MKMRVAIDRFEGNYAVCEKEDRTMMNIERSKLPSGAREGDILDITDGIIKMDAEETARRMAEAKKLMDDLWK